MSASPKLSPERLQCPKELFGRADELAQLDAAWASEGQTRVVTIIAWGGVGKTALAAWWRSRLLETRSDVEAVLEWSSYSQGTQDRNAATAERFIHEALLFFDERELAESPAGQRVKATRLVEVIRARRVVLILDGLEPLQHPPDGAGLGALKEEGLAVLLQGLARRSRGLCVVTSRERVRELESFEKHGAPCIELDRLDARAGSQLLRSVLEGEMRAVAPVPSSEAERGEIVTVFEGHALSLLLIGSYVRRALGDVRRWREIDLREADLATQRGRVWRVMEQYSTWLAGAGSEGHMQLAVARMLGLFDRPADPGCIAALLKTPAIPGLTDGLVGLERERWRLVLTGLQEARLLGLAAYQAVAVFGYSELVAEAAGEKGLPKGEPERWLMPDYGSDAVVLDAHPLVREYFGDELRRTNEAAWREGHRRLYEHLCESVPHWPEGIEGLQPLFQAIVHGCVAGRVEESCDAVYRGRILRGERAYSTKQLGALGAELGALANFFEHAWDRPARELSAGDRAWLLSEAAFDLRAVGRLSEALEPMRASLDMAVEIEHWKNAAIRAGNLSELELTLGRVAAAVADASMAVAHADRSGDEDWRMASRTTLADARLAAGELDQARALFERAESMEAQRYPSAPELYSLPGHRICDLLLLAVERAAWLASMQRKPPEPELVSVCETVSARAKRALAIAVRNRWTLDIALDQLTLGRAALYAARLDAAPTLARASEHLDAAVATLREAGHQEFIPKGLLTRAWLHHLEGHDDLARADLDEAWSIAERGPMPLIQADIHLHRARLFHDHAALAAAEQLIHKHGYARRLPELADAQLAAATWPTPTPDPLPTPPPKPTPPMTTIRILHISDIHFRWTSDPSSERGTFIKLEIPRRASVIMGPNWQRNVEAMLEDGRIDLVCLTGDVADWAQPQEYGQATQFIDALLKSLQLDRDRLFVIPGNHDINRKCNESTWKKARPRCNESPDSTSRWMAGLQPPTGVKPAWRDEILARTSAFWTWLEHDMSRAELLPSRSPHGRLGYRVDVGPRLGLSAPCWLIGLDTAWLAGDDHDARKLMLTDDQIRQLATGEDGQSLPGLRLALGHHPLGELADEIRARRLLAQHVDLYLHGHQHETTSSLHVDPNRTSIELAAGCLFEGTRLDGHANGHTIITLKVDAAGRPCHGELRLRSWSPSGMHWHDDSSIYEAAKQGRLRLTWPGAPEVAAAPAAPPTPPPAAAAPANPAKPANPALQLWREKLAYLRTQEPLTVDPDAKFRLGKLIEEAIAKIREHGGEP